MYIKVVQRARPPKASIVIVECTNLFSLELQSKIFYLKVKDHSGIKARDIQITNQAHLCPFHTRCQLDLDLYFF